MIMRNLNYHHLRYFREVATHGHLGQTAETLNLSQSALSIQIKQLEERIGHTLFDRVGRRLVLTEAGRIALDYADSIFQQGEELLAVLNEQSVEARPLRVGSVSTLSRNFQLQFLRPLLSDQTFGVALFSGDLSSLLDRLQSQALDVVLTTEVPTGAPVALAARKIDEQAVGLHGAPQMMIGSNLSALLSKAPIILPTEPVIQAGFEDLTARRGVAPTIVARVDDMAMVRLLARERIGLAVAPSVVLADELASGRVVTAPFDLGLVEPFYAITLPRRFPHPALARLLS